MEIGEARVTLVKTKNGIYGLNGDRQWDALPCWEFYPAIIVRAEWKKEGKEYRRNEILTDFEKTICGDDIPEEYYKTIRARAEERALEKALVLEESGFKVSLGFETNYCSQDLSNVLEEGNARFLVASLFGF